MLTLKGMHECTRACGYSHSRVRTSVCGRGCIACGRLTVADLGVAISGRVPVVLPSNKHSVGYMKAKTSRMGHLTGL